MNGDRRVERRSYSCTAMPRRAQSSPRLLKGSWTLDTESCSLVSRTMPSCAGLTVSLDLWGRGYSDTPLDCRHDVRLFASQMLLALTSSPLSWMGNGNTFAIVAFSLGGTISLAFTAAFPESVRSLVQQVLYAACQTATSAYTDPKLPRRRKLYAKGCDESSKWPHPARH
jgi:hypothetical protein